MLISKIKKELISQRKSKFKSNIYHYFQVDFAYNSNKIEGDHTIKHEQDIYEWWQRKC